MFSTVMYETAKQARMCGYHDAHVTVIETVKCSDNYTDAMFVIDHMQNFAEMALDYNIDNDGPVNDFFYTQTYIATLNMLADSFRWNHLATTDNNSCKEMCAYLNTDIADTTRYFLKLVL